MRHIHSLLLSAILLSSAGCSQITGARLVAVLLGQEDELCRETTAQRQVRTDLDRFNRGERLRHHRDFAELDHHRRLLLGETRAPLPHERAIGAR